MSHKISNEQNHWVCVKNAADMPWNLLIILINLNYSTIIFHWNFNALSYFFFWVFHWRFSLLEYIKWRMTKTYRNVNRLCVNVCWKVHVTPVLGCCVYSRLFDAYLARMQHLPILLNVTASERVCVCLCMVGCVCASIAGHARICICTQSIFSCVCFVSLCMLIPFVSVRFSNT